MFRLRVTASALLVPARIQFSAHSSTVIFDWQGEPLRIFVTTAG
jgi:hypothetical protein